MDRALLVVVASRVPGHGDAKSLLARPHVDQGPGLLHRWRRVQVPVLAGQLPREALVVQVSLEGRIPVPRLDQRAGDVHADQGPGVDRIGGQKAPGHQGLEILIERVERRK